MRASSAGCRLAPRSFACRSRGRGCASSMTRWPAGRPSGATASRATWPGCPGPSPSRRSTPSCASRASTGQVLSGPPGRPFIGAVAPNAFEERLRSVMDPHGRFSTGLRLTTCNIAFRLIRPIRNAMRMARAVRDVRALRLLPGRLPDLQGARRGDGLAARAHRADEAGARGRTRARRRAAAHRPLPRVSRVRDGMSVGCPVRRPPHALPVGPGDRAHDR